MGQILVVRATAKINLGLTVQEIRADGYHEIESVMQQVSLADYLVLKPAGNRKVMLTCTDPDLEGNDNLVYRAAELLMRNTAKSLPGVRIRLYKNIPVEAGLAGGSADAAAAFKGLNEFWQLDLSEAELLEMAAKIGSDVPYCLQGGTALARGRGEVLEKLPDCPFFWVVLALPAGARISTAAAYRSFNRNYLARPSLFPLVGAIKEGSRKEIRQWFCESLTNTLETADLPEAQTYINLKQQLLSYGFKPLLSGSGPTLFMFFDYLMEARSALQAVEQSGGKAYLCWTEKGKGK
jgi:4-diphosphocytidyl-2-C-methyl-D-erythritol kinase